MGVFSPSLGVAYMNTITLKHCGFGFIDYGAHMHFLSGLDGEIVTISNSYIFSNASQY